MIIENLSFFLSKIVVFTSYVNNFSGFPTPLDEKEEHELFNRFHNGDSDAKNKLIKHNLRLVAHIVKKYTGTAEADDLLSVGTIGLIKAINTFKYGKNTQLSTYAARCIENEILMLIRVNKKHKNVSSLEQCLGEDKDGNEIELMDVIANEDEDLEESVETNILSDKILKIIKNSLSDREFKIIIHRFGLNGCPALTQREVAQKLGISRSYISRLETKAIETVRKEIKNKKILF